jgi:hypothetical protein
MLQQLRSLLAELKLRLTPMRRRKYDYVSEEWLKEHDKW